MKSVTQFLFHISLKTQILSTEIPKQYWDSNLRKISAKLSYEIMKMTLQLNETFIGKRVVYSQIKLFNKKWYTVSRIEMVPEEVIVDKKDDKKGQKDAKKDAKKGKEQAVITEDLQAIKPKLIPKFVRELYQSSTTLQDYLEETLLSISEEYGEYVQSFVEKWREQIEQMEPFVDNPPEQLEKLKAELSTRLEQWESLKDVNRAYGEIQTKYKASPLYLEISCKFLRRILETIGDAKLINDQFLAQIQDPAPTESVKFCNDVRDLKISAIEKDIEWDPNSLRELISEKETNKEGNDDAIDIFNKYYDKYRLLQESVQKENEQYQLNLLSGSQQYNYQYYTLWLAELYNIRSLVAYLQVGQKRIKETQAENYCEILQLDLNSLKSAIQENASLNQQPQAEEAFIKQMIISLKNLAFSCFYAATSRAWGVLQNNVKQLLNVITFEQLNPFIFKGTEAYKYISLVADCALSMLLCAQNETWFFHRDQKKKEMQQFTAKVIERAKPAGDNLKSVTFDAPETVENFHEYFFDPNNQNQPKPTLTNKLSKDYWFTSVEQLDIISIGNLMAYVTNTLLVENKHNLLIGLTRKFCNITTHYYSQYILPFTLNSQDLLYQNAALKTAQKREAKKKREDDHEVWRKENLKKRTRTDMLTGFQPAEEIAFQNDIQEFEQQIKLLQNKEDQIKAEREISHQLLSDIEKGANNGVESLKQARRARDVYAQALKNFNRETQYYDDKQFDANMKKQKQQVKK